MNREPTKLRGRVVTPEGVLADAVVRLEFGRVVEVTPAERSRASRSAAWIVPGFVDLHVHGGGGATFTTGNLDQARAAIAFHRGHGTTTMLASLVTASQPDTLAHTATLAELVHSGELAGVHLEGPYLSTARCGAQNPAYLRDPESAEIESLIATGVVRVMTLAPELPGALPAIAELRSHGV